MSLIGERKVGNAFVTGQKRVGKTSLALTAQDLLSDEPDLVVLFVDAGTYIHPRAEQTITQMGQAIAEELLAADSRFANVELQTFEATLAPLRALIGQLRRSVPKLRVLVVLDEFDELPLQLYRRGNIGDAFFLALRALAAQEHIGFLLVGGEKMDPIIDAQGDQLNKFVRVPVTYLDRTRHWDDFSDLVRRPVHDVLDITDESVTALYDQTAGHPYFTKLICQAMFSLSVNRRDSHVTEIEIQEAVGEALRTASVTNFIHFWEDGILATGEQTEEISIRRRKILLAYAEGRASGPLRTDDLLKRCETYGLTLDEARESVREFERRDVLRTSDGETVATVRFFDLWLREAGVTAITTTFTDPEAILHAKQRELQLRVTPEELSAVVAGWGHYRGTVIGVEQARSWLYQFADAAEQRLMFQILRGLRFYDAGRIRAKLRETHGVAVRGVRQRHEKGKLKRSEFVVSYFGGPAESGARYARLYADENAIYAGNVVAPDQLGEHLSDEECQALILVDDFLGSGQQASTYLAQLEARHGTVIRRRELKVFLAVICGFATAQQRLQDVLNQLGLPVEVHVCDVLGGAQRCFQPESEFFDSTADRERAQEIAEAYGRRLQRRAPLGYENVQAAVVFDEGCPNGSLPILWDSKGDWRALFPRHKGR